MKMMQDCKMKIESYKFGEMVIDGTSYNNDLVIAGGNIHTRWFRQEGHAVRPMDLEKWISNGCKRLIVGTGAAGYCKVTHELEKYCKERSIDLVALPTAKAIEEFNVLTDKANTVAAFHLTC